jgi:hypothetical protein
MPFCVIADKYLREGNKYQTFKKTEWVVLKNGMWNGM